MFVTISVWPLWFNNKYIFNGHSTDIKQKEVVFLLDVVLKFDRYWHPVIRNNFSIKDLENKKDYCS